MNADRRRVLLIGLDAADADVVERLVGAGEMPNLQALRGSGLHGRLESPADHFPGGVWPTFYTGRGVAAHGAFHNKLWRPSEMRVEVPTDRWLDARPFWEALPERVRVCIVDVPMALGQPRPVNGVCLGGWGPHDLMGRGSWPDDLWTSCERRWGRPAMPAETFGRQSEGSLSRLRGQLVAATRQLTDLALDLMRSAPWDLTCVVLSTTHRAGHYLWDRSQLADGEEVREEPHADLVAIYGEADAALGRLVAAAPEDALILVFSVHGMGPNAGWADLFPDMLSGLAEHASGRRPRPGLLYRAKRRIPFHWVRPLLRRLPIAVNQRLVSLWSRNMFDWPTTRWFPLPMDGPAHIRINLRGRERDGIVEPGAEYDAVCEEIERLALGLRDADSGEPLARTAFRAFASAPDDAPARALLPDLIIPFTGPPATFTRRVVSETFPDFGYDVPATLPSGRSGNHTTGAWFVARGPDVAVGEAPRVHDIVDVVPTVLRRLGVAPTHGMEGTPIDLQRSR